MAKKSKFRSQAQARYLFATHPAIAKEFASKTPSIKSLPEHIKKKIKVNNKIKAYGQEDDRTGQIEINVKKHKGDKQELADTIKHELIHQAHPKMHEKTVYKKTKGEIKSNEVKKLLKLLKNK